MDAPLRCGFWIRCAAATIDLVCVAISVIAIVYTLYWIGLVPQDWQRVANITYWIAMLVVASFDIWIAASPGKKILRLAVARHDGTHASTSSRVLRWAIMYAPFVLYIANDVSANNAVAWTANLWLVGVLIGCLAASNDDKQAWHDQLAGTAVFRRRDVYPAQPVARGFDPVPPPLPPSES
jgi:uncharacterized RDD family membrane protein YckC